MEKEDYISAILCVFVEKQLVQWSKMDLEQCTGEKILFLMFIASSFKVITWVSALWVLQPFDQHYPPIIPLTEGRLVTLRPLGQFSKITTALWSFHENIRVFASQKTIRLYTTFREIKNVSQPRVISTNFANTTYLATLWMFCWQNWL